MKVRVKYVKYDANWHYVLQVKKWIFWKTIEKFTTFDNAKEHLDKLKKVDDFNSESLNKQNVIKFKIKVKIKTIGQSV